MIYPTIRLWSISDTELQQLSWDDRASMMQRAIVPGIDLMGGYRLHLTADTSNLNDRGRENTLNQLTDILRARLNGVGIIEPVVRRAGNQSIMVEVPASADTVSILRLLRHTGRLTFRLFKEGTEVQELRQRIDTALVKRAAADSIAGRPPSTVLFSEMLSSLIIDDGIADIVVEDRMVPAVRALLADSTVQEVIQAFNRANPPAGTFVWASKSADRSGRLFYPLYFVNQEPDVIGNPLTSAQVSDASPATADHGPYAVRVSLNDDGREDLTNVSSANIGKRLAIGLNEQTLTILMIQGRIPDGRAEIPGGKTLIEAQNLAVALQTGMLPLPISATVSEPIPPTVEGGTETVETGIMVGVVALLLVSILLILVYRVGGGVAILGLLFHFIMTGAILRLWIIAGITPLLTLSGVVGLILALILMIGTHILLFERIREELADQIAPRAAVVNAYDSVKPILIWIHGVILLLSLIFFVMGTGPVLDGALSLFSGVAASLLTVLLMTQTILKTATTEWNLSRLNM